MIEIRVVRAHLDWRVGNIEFDWPHATGFEVDEDDSRWGTEEVARVRFSVQQLVGGRTALYGFACAVKRAQEKVTVTVIQRGLSLRFVTTRSAAATRSMKCGASIWTFRMAACSRWSATAYSAGSAGSGVAS